MSWVVDPEVLIVEVESRPILYAKSLPEYSNKTMKNNAWREVTQKLSDEWDSLTNGEKHNRCREIQAKWKHIRDNFRREYQAQKEGRTEQGAKKKKKYRYYDDLLFLAPHVKESKTSENYSGPVYEYVEERASPLTVNIEYSPPGPSTATHKVSETSKRKKETTSSLEDAIIKAMRNEISETDEDKTFCLSLVQSFKKMDDDNKMLAKIEILNVIRTFKNRSRTCVDQTESLNN